MFGFIGDWILGAILKAVWLVFVQGPLTILGGFDKALKFLSGGIVWKLLFGGKQEFSWAYLPIAFWGFIIVAVLLLIIIFAINFIKMQFHDTIEIKASIIKSLKMTGLAAIIIFSLPMVFFLLNAFIIFLVSIMNNIFGIKNNNIMGAIYNIGNPIWNGQLNDYPDDFLAPENILEWNITAQIFGTWFMLFAIFMLGLALVQKVLELYFLFIIGPVVATTMVNDGGERINTWKNLVISKSLASIGTIISYYVFMIAMSAVFSSGFSDFNWTERQLLTILFICGGALATLGMSNLIARFVGEASGIHEGMSSIQSTAAGAMFAMGGAKMVGRAFGFARRKKAQLDQNKSGFNKYLNPAQQFAQDYAGTNRVIDNGPIKPPMTGLRARSGITGLIGSTLLTGTRIATSLKGAHKAGGMKSVFAQVGKSLIVDPTKSLGKNLNPGLAKFGRGVHENAIKINTEKVKNRFDNNNSKITKLQNKLVIEESKGKIGLKTLGKIEKLQNANFDLEYKINTNKINTNTKMEFEKPKKVKIDKNIKSKLPKIEKVNIKDLNKLKEELDKKIVVDTNKPNLKNNNK